jgi:hypothetical protein
MFKTIRSKETSQIARLQDPSQINGDSLNNVRHDANRHFRKKVGNIWRAELMCFQHSRNKNIRDLCIGINEFMNSYQPRTNLVKNGNGDLADSQNSLNSGRITSLSYWIYLGLAMLDRWKCIHLCVILLMLKLLLQSWRIIDQILAELTQAGGETLHPEICKLINSIWNKEEFPVQWGGVFYGSSLLKGP